MLSKEKLRKIFDKVYSVKRINRIHVEGDQKILSNLKANKTHNLIPKHNRAKTLPKDFFLPINDFATTTNNNLDISNLYKSKLLPSQHLSTPKLVIKRLTNNIYVSPAITEFPLQLPNPVIKKQRLKKRIIHESYSNTKENSNHVSYDNLNNSCVEFLNENKKSRMMLKRKQKFLHQKIRNTKNAVRSLEKSNKRVGYYLFHKKLQEGHAHLLKLDKIHPKKYQPPRDM